MDDRFGRARVRPPPGASLLTSSTDARTPMNLLLALLQLVVSAVSSPTAAMPGDPADWHEEFAWLTPTLRDVDLRDIDIEAEPLYGEDHLLFVGRGDADIIETPDGWVKPTGESIVADNAVDLPVL